MTTLQLTLLVGHLLSNNPDVSASEPASKNSDALANLLTNFKGCWVDKKSGTAKNWLTIETESQLLGDSVLVSRCHVESSETPYEALVVFSKDNDKKTRARVWEKKGKKPFIETAQYTEYEAFSGAELAVMVGPFLNSEQQQDSNQSDPGKRLFTIKYRHTPKKETPEIVTLELQEINEKKEKVGKQQTIEFKKGVSCPPSKSSTAVK